MNPQQQHGQGSKGGKPMTTEDAARIQSAADRPGGSGDEGFKQRAQAAAAKNQPSGQQKQGGGK